MKAIASFALTLAPFALAACGSTIPTDRNSRQAGRDNVSMALNGTTGNMAISVPGFAGNISVPGMSKSITDFDIDGVELYPGSQVASMNMEANDGAANVRIGFTSPAGVAAVREHFRKSFAAKNMTVGGDASVLSGTTADGDRFTIGLSPDGADRTKGLVTIADTKK